MIQHTHDDWSELAKMGSHPLVRIASLFYAKTDDGAGGGGSTETGESDGTQNTEPNGDGFTPLTDAQQAHVDGLISERIKRASRRSDEDHAELETLRAEKQERETEAETARQTQLAEEGKFQQIITEKETQQKEIAQQHAKKVREVEAELQIAYAALRDYHTDAAIDRGIGSVEGVMPKIIPVIRDMLRRGHQLEGRFVKVKAEKGENGDYTTLVVDGQDQRVTDGKGQFLDETSVVQLLVAEFPQFVSAGSRGGSGGAFNQPARVPDPGQAEALSQTAKGSNRTADIVAAWRAEIPRGDN